MGKSSTSLLQRIALRTAVVLAVSYVLINLGTAIQRNYTVNKAIRQLRAEIADLETRIAFLKNKIVYLQSDAYRELEAKRRLGLRRTGEQVALVPANTDGDERTDTPVPTLTVDQTDTEPAGFFERASANALSWVHWLQRR